MTSLRLISLPRKRLYTVKRMFTAMESFFPKAFLNLCPTIAILTSDHHWRRSSWQSLFPFLLLSTRWSLSSSEMCFSSNSQRLLPAVGTSMVVFGIEKTIFFVIACVRVSGSGCNRSKGNPLGDIRWRWWRGVHFESHFLHLFKECVACAERRSQKRKKVRNLALQRIFIANQREEDIRI